MANERWDDFALDQYIEEAKRQMRAIEEGLRTLNRRVEAVRELCAAGVQVAEEAEANREKQRTKREELDEIRAERRGRLLLAIITASSAVIVALVAAAATILSAT